MSDTPAASSDDPRLAAFLRQRFGAQAERLRLTALAGDASTRSYYRVAHGDETCVLALYPEPLPDGPLAFLDVQRLLAQWGLPVPEVLACDRARGIMLQSDLGDLSLQ